MKKSLILLGLAAISFGACKQEAKTNEKDVEVVKSDEQKYIDAIVDYSEYDLASLGIDDAKYFKPLKAGDDAPDFTLKNAEGEDVKLSDMTEEGNVALVFYRGHWCPACNGHLKSLTADLEKLADSGVRLVAITPDNYENIAKVKSNTGATFTILSDPQAKAMKDF